MGIFTKLMAGAGLGGAPAAGGRQKFQKILTVTDLLDTDPVIPTAQFTRLGKYTVPAQQLYRWGYGDVNHPDSMGYVYVYIETDAPGEFIDGKLRLVQSDANGYNTIVVTELLLSQTHGSLTNRAMQLPLPEQLQHPMVGEDSLLYLELETSTGDTMDTSDCVISLPTTVYV